MRPEAPWHDVWERRRAALVGNGQLRGLEYVEVLEAPSPGHAMWLELHFVPSDVTGKDPVPPFLEPRNLRIEGPLGEVWPTSIHDVRSEDGVVRVRVAGAEEARKAVESFTLRLVDVPDIDPYFASAEFLLTPRPWPGDPEPPEKGWEIEGVTRPRIDYLNKDYASFRRLMLQSMTESNPKWEERDVADLGMALVEILAYAGDGLSYYQDAVGTERTMDAARLRVSLRRHLRLIGYRLHDGCNARVWVHVEVLERLRLPQGTLFVADALPNVPPRVGPIAFAPYAHHCRHAFELVGPRPHLFPEQNRMRVYAWGAQEFTLPAGSVRATLRGHIRGLRAGSVLVFERPFADSSEHFAHPVRLVSDPVHAHDELFPTEGAPTPVTEVVWADSDALPVDIPIMPEEGFLVLGNMVLADHGRTIENVGLPRVPEGEPCRPILPDTAITQAVPYDPEEAKRVPACRSLDRDPSLALAAVWVSTEDPARDPDPHHDLWHARQDLLASGPNASHFVVEVENDGLASLRFGDGKLGRRPTPGDAMSATYRLGNGSAGNVGPRAIELVVCDDPRVTGAWNPQGASGGVDPQRMEEARLLGPYSFLGQRRCVNDEDYREFVKSLPEVQGAFVDRAWRGGRGTTRIYVQRTQGWPETPDFLAEVTREIEPRRLIGTRIEAHAPRYLPLAMDLRVWLTRDAALGPIRTAIVAAFSNVGDGLFAPFRFTFGTMLFESEIVARAKSFEGVERVEVRSLGILGGTSGHVLRPRPDEILRLDPDALNIEFVTR